MNMLLRHCLFSAALSAAGCADKPNDPRPPRAEPPPSVPADTATLRILTDQEAKRLATTFLNEQLKGRKFLAPSGEIEFSPIEAAHWESIVYDYRQRRIVLRFGGYGGWEATVSFGPDGADPKVDHAEFAWD